jgi:hypothetical protein
MQIDAGLHCKEDERVSSDSRTIGERQQRRYWHPVPAQAAAAERCEPRPVECIARLRMTPRLRRDGADLLNQQLWCWGYDIRRDAGNLLIAHGFERVPAPEGSSWRSAYHLTLEPGRGVSLWGFGMLYCDAEHGALFLKRFGFQPRLLPDAVPPRTCFIQEHLPAQRTPTTPSECREALLLLRDALEWIAAYETWVLDTAGCAHRQAALDAWRALRKRVLTSADGMPQAWHEMAYACTHDAGVFHDRALSGSPVSDTVSQ